MKPKYKYFLNSLAKTLSNRRETCPSCGEANLIKLDGKYFVTSLMRCGNCGLQFRTPTASAEEQAAYYQKEYKRGFTTELPDPEFLALLKKTKFKNTGKDYSERISILDYALQGKRGRLLDFGCSWGYGSWQFAHAGFEVVGFEISKPRCAYAREKLSIEAYDNLDHIKGNFDVFYSSHVLEHVPSVKSTLDYAFSKLKSGGLFVSFMPNGSEAFKNKDHCSWHRLWGLDHPNFLDDRFFEKYLKHKAHFITSTPANRHEITSWISGNYSAKGDLSNSELIVFAKN